STTDPMIHKMANDLIALKKKMSQQVSNVTYQDIPRWNFNNTNGMLIRDRPQLTTSEPRLAIKSPLVNVVVEIVEEDEEPEAQDYHEAFESLGYADESYDDSARDSNIRYLEYEEDGCEPDIQYFA
ncbi:hypothetical protein KI387_041144, partial [Taxus chinensis]